MSEYDKIFKHIAGEFPQDIAVLALKTSEVEVTDRLNTDGLRSVLRRSGQLMLMTRCGERFCLHSRFSEVL